MFLLYISFCDRYLHILHELLSTIFMQNKGFNNNNNNKGGYNAIAILNRKNIIILLHL